MQSSVGATQWGRDHLKKSGKSTAARPSGDLWLLERKQGMISGPAHPPGRPTVRSGRLFQLAVIALLGLAALISVAPVEAQSVASFVSNFDQGQDSSTFTRGVRAQSFNTGWDAGRITLHSVDIRVESASTIPDSAQSRFSMYLCPPNADGFPLFVPQRSPPIQPVWRSRRRPALRPRPPSPSPHPPIPAFSGVRATSWSM